MEKTAPQTAVLDQLVDGDAAEIVHWRFDSLVRAGYAESAAVILAAHTEVDLHLAVDLVVQGCPPATAMRILL